MKTDKNRPDLEEFFLVKFHELEPLFAQLRLGFEVLDRELRYHHVNERMATIDRMPPQVKAVARDRLFIPKIGSSHK